MKTNEFMNSLRKSGNYPESQLLGILGRIIENMTEMIPPKTYKLVNEKCNIKPELTQKQYTK